jgi:hypothetical protein
MQGTIIYYKIDIPDQTHSKLIKRTRGRWRAPARLLIIRTLALDVFCPQGTMASPPFPGTCLTTHSSKAGGKKETNTSKVTVKISAAAHHVLIQKLKTSSTKQRPGASWDFQAAG